MKYDGRGKSETQDESKTKLHMGTGKLPTVSVKQYGWSSPRLCIVPPLAFYPMAHFQHSNHVCPCLLRKKTVKILYMHRSRYRGSQSSSRKTQTGASKRQRHETFSPAPLPLTRPSSHRARGALGTRVRSGTLCYDTMHKYNFGLGCKEQGEGRSIWRIKMESRTCSYESKISRRWLIEPPTAWFWEGWLRAYCIYRALTFN